MTKLASHNAMTGEASLSWYHNIFKAFAKCQSKTLKEQMEGGIEAFDLRFKYDGDGMLRGAHGLWLSETTALEALARLYKYSMSVDKKIWVLICYEGELDYRTEKRFVSDIKSFLESFDTLGLIQVAVKKPSWKVLVDGNCPYSFHQAHKVLDFRSWHTLLPIPLLWKWNQDLDKSVDYNWCDFV